MSTPFYDLASLVVVPSGYKSGKIYAQKPLTTDGQLTFTRASTATRVNASGLIESVASGVPRLDYQGSTCPKLLLEPQRTNLAVYSEEYDNAVYTKVNLTASANTTASPTGATNADSILESNTNSTHESWQRVSMTSGQAYTQSCFFKANGRTRVIMQTFDNATMYANGIFDLSAGTVVASSGGATIQAISNGWYRCSISGTSPATGLGYCVIALCENTYATPSVVPTYTGDTSKGVYFFGFQLEAGAYATSYIPTTSAAVTRLADAASKTGISSLIGQTEGTLFGELKITAYDPNGFIPVYLKNSAGSNEVYVWFQTDGRIRGRVYNASAAQADIFTDAGFATVGGTYKFALAYKQNDFAFYVNGQQIGTDTSGTVGATSEFYFTYAQLSGFSFPLNINQALIFPTRLTNAQLAELTTL
jgi:hypothetical protein